MSTFIRGHMNVLLGLGAGIAIGACATLALQRLTLSLDQKLARLVTTIETLQEEVQQLNSRLQKAEKSSVWREEEYRQQQRALENEQHNDEDDDWEEDVFQDPMPESELEGGEAGLRGITSQVAAPLSVDSSALYAQVDQLMDGSDQHKQQALTLLNSKHSQYCEDAEYLWRLAKAHYQNALIEEARGQGEKHRQLFFRSVEHIRDALQRGEHLPQVHKWYAITLGKLGDFLGTQEKIKNGFIFKEHIEKAIDLDPKDSSSHYLLGRWCYGVYMLTWLERKAAATLFATPPSSTVDEALDKFMRAEELADKPWKENRLFIAKCYVEKHDYASAAAWLLQAKQVPTTSPDDKTAEVEVDGLLNKYGRYAA